MIVLLLHKVTVLPLPFIFRGAKMPGPFVHAISQGTSVKLLAQCDANAPPCGTPYLCIVPVNDFWRMSAAKVGSDGWHYSRGIEPQILDDIRAQRCAVIFDLCNEGPAYDSTVFNELFSWIEANQLPAGQVVWLAQNRNIEKACRAHAGASANLVRFEYYDFFVKMMAVLFARSPPTLDVAMGTPEFIDRMYSVGNKDKLLMCLNATPRLPRVLTIAAIMHHELFDESLVSFPGMNYAKSHESSKNIHDYLATRASLGYLKPGVDRVLELADLKVDRFKEVGDSLYDKIDIRPYERTFFSVVTETDFSDGSIYRITEKAVKTFCLGHPSVIVGNPRSIQLMTELGFSEWGGVIDSGYDEENDQATRFNRLFAEVARQVELIRAGPVSWIRRVREVGVANIAHATTGGFLRNYCQLYDGPLLKRMAALLNPVVPGSRTTTRDNVSVPHGQIMVSDGR